MEDSVCVKCNPQATHVLAESQIGGGMPSNGFAFAACDTSFQSLSLESGVRNRARLMLPELKSNDIWLARIVLYSSAIPRTAPLSLPKDHTRPAPPRW